MDAKTIIQAFRDSRPLHDLHVTDSLSIAPDPFRGEVKCVQCRFSSFEANCTVFNEPVTFTDCRFDVLSFYAAYFLKGLTVEECEVSEPLTFSSGGHNHESTPITITNTRFMSFVDFEDCWFTGPLRLENVEFVQGTNLFGNQKTPMAVQFDFGPELVAVKGDLDIDTYKPKVG
ncbi:MAG: hypothetical protein ACIAXF_03085 [Phycisphaerales bacterium JB063]